jgi:hypothetical protein
MSDSSCAYSRIASRRRRPSAPRGARIALVVSVAGGVALWGSTGALAEPKQAGQPAAAASAASAKPAREPVASSKRPAFTPDAAHGQQFRASVAPFLRKHCLECHDRDTLSGGVNLEASLDFAAAATQRKVWTKARKMLESGAMPPAEHEVRPSEAETAAVIDWIDRAFFQPDCAQVHDPGRVTIRRLNRTEYNNTIRDLLGVPLRLADDFPTDDVGEGFDNIGDVLSVSPLLTEKFLDAAERAAWVALVGIDLKRPPAYSYEPPGMKPRGSAQLARKLFGNDPYYVIPTAGSVSISFACPLRGEYVFRVLGCARQAGEEPAQLELRVDGKPQKVVDLGGDLEPARYECRVQLKRGPHDFGVRFVNPLTEAPPPPLPQARDDAGTRRRRKRQRSRPAREIVVQLFEVEGPFQVDPRDLSQASLESRKRLVFCSPPNDGTPRECVSRILTRLGRRAFRRPLAEDEIKPYVELALAAAAQEGASPHESFNAALQTGVTAILVSPHFLFRVEQPGAASEGDGPVPISADELASRLSYFLWSSMPDDELFERAADGSLLKPEVLESQARRMLRDPKSQALVSSFAAQWLNLGQLDLVKPDRGVFREFNEELRLDMRRETDLFVESMVREDRSIMDLLSGRNTFLNERLARHYGIAGVRGSDFRPVSLEGTQRAGVLTMASVLTLTSQRSRTSPVKRGKWILENLLGSAPPPPPANVPELEAAKRVNPEASLREQLEIHRKKAACISCHKVMDPLGFGLENFDGIGRWRSRESGKPIDSSGVLPGGDSFQGPLELVAVLRKREGAFRRHFARTLLTYALGRRLEYDDQCAVERIVERTHAGGDRFSALVTAIVHSDPFRLRRGGGYRHEE